MKKSMMRGQDRKKEADDLESLRSTMFKLVMLRETLQSKLINLGQKGPEPSPILVLVSKMGTHSSASSISAETMKWFSFMGIAKSLQL
jgi:hypothetical protein